VLYAVEWFPQEYAAVFYAVKGGLALVATLLYLAHMSRAWHRLTSRGQRWRYLVLLYLSVLLTVATVEQIQDRAFVSYRNVGALVGTVLLLIAAVVSLREDRRPNLQEKP
jgi:hypothetical protein